MSVSNQTWCWYCKQSIPPEAEICPFCSKALPAAKKVVKCPGCGKYVLMASEACQYCGAALHTAAQAPDPQSASAAQMWGAFPASSEAQDDSSGWSESSEQTDSVYEGFSAQDRQAALETLAQLEALGAQQELHEQHAAKNRGKKKSQGRFSFVRIMTFAAAFALIWTGIYYGFIRRGSEPAPVQEAVACADNAHQWVEADCEHPRTCSVCGATEGEPLGHHYVNNVCTLCGAVKKPFYFSDPGCRRDPDAVVFWGDVKNYTGENVEQLQLKLDLYDSNMNPVVSELGYAINGSAMPELGTVRWEMRYNDAGLTWKYWRISAIDYTPAA